MPTNSEAIGAIVFFFKVFLSSYALRTTTMRNILEPINEFEQNLCSPQPHGIKNFIIYILRTYQQGV